ncbi:ribonuclease D [Pseudoxanthomonas broegbernensis]|uniref:Ribonuclease D n=1 Tax=Pseudoxanthomonas broegbernensis TaxID=83619 RepID=A0A7V8GPT3_9GAMM|nr:ribonuclease D [Pseudoxanthomonas broegbernensis]KAF1687957.1 ribonuclease D [Pseudoxanthomonas broegbernensis]MBB6064967.1 ribonuclease D [Pseudoxanthomonas broegbernensis]
MPSPIWIEHPDELLGRLQSAPARIGLDTEFIRERTYWPRLALVQMALGEDILLVDPLVPGMPQALAAWLDAPGVLKVMHSASEDLVAFKCTCGTLPRPMYDTQIAAALAGFGAGLGYQKLVERITGTVLPKGETRSDWLRRPLSPAQLDYAADDVRHLAAVHDATGQRLHELGRQAWLEEDVQRLLGQAARDEGERWPHLSLRMAQFLDEDGQHRLLRLLRWRERYAREHDHPRNWVLDNELAAALARDPPIDATDLQRRLDALPKSPRRLGSAIWQALSTPLADEADMPAPPAEPDRNAVRRLQDAVARRSAERGLPDGVLASRRHLEALLEGGPWPAALQGWRRDELEPVLAPLLAGAPATG